MKILVLNAGSSSIKYELFQFPDKQRLFAGMIERIGEPQSCHHYQLEGQQQQTLKIASHQQAFSLMLETLAKAGFSLSNVQGIAHRVVHGAHYFQQPTLIDVSVIEQLEQLIPLAPLHNPANITGIKIARQLAAETPQVAVFDTAFHHTLPDYAMRYAIPEHYYQQQHIRRYGFHGTSHAYVAKQAARYLNKPLSELNLITLHLGNGASACAIQHGVSIDTSMGFTPQEGLMMGTRCGDIDAAIYPYLAQQAGLAVTEIDRILNKESGLKGIASSNDMREIHRLIAEGDEHARLAFAMYCYRIKKYIGAYYAILGRLDALVFTGGIGEHDAILRETCCTGLNHLGLKILSEKNQAVSGAMDSIHDMAQKTAILVIKTDEALEIAQQTYDLLARRDR